MAKRTINKGEYDKKMNNLDVKELGGKPPNKSAVKQRKNKIKDKGE